MWTQFERAQQQTQLSDSRMDLANCCSIHKAEIADGALYRRNGRHVRGGGEAAVIEQESPNRVNLNALGLQFGEELTLGHPSDAKRL
jgi:hypothetical protein